MCESFAATSDGDPEASPSRPMSLTVPRREIDGAQREGIGDVQGLARACDAAGQGQRARDHGANRAARAVDLVDRVVGHVGDEQAAVGCEGQVVEIRRCRRDARLLVRGAIDLEYLAGRVVDGEELALRVEVRSGRRGESVGDDLGGSAVDIHAHDLGAEPEWPAQAAVRAEVEAVEPTEVLAHEARLGLALAIELPERIAGEDLGAEQAATGIEGEGVHARQIPREDAKRAVRCARVHRPVHEAGEVERAVGGELEIVGLALGRRHDQLRASTGRVHAVDRLSHHTADPDHAVRTDRHAVDPAEGSAGHEPVALPFGGGRVVEEQGDQDGDESCDSAWIDPRMRAAEGETYDDTRH